MYLKVPKERQASALPTCTYINTAHQSHVDPSSCNAPQYYNLHLPNVKDFTCQWGNSAA